MNVDALLSSMSPQVYEKLLGAVETGKWLDGKPLSESQRETCLQAIMIYQSKVLKNNQHMTVGANGEIIHKSRQQLKNELAQDSSIARFKQDDF